MDKPETITIWGRECPVCKKKSALIVDKKAFESWVRGKLIQDAFPEMPKDQRELLITGIHPECWKIAFPPEED